MEKIEVSEPEDSQHVIARLKTPRAAEELSDLAAHLDARRVLQKLPALAAAIRSWRGQAKG